MPIQELSLAKATIVHGHTTYPELSLAFLKTVEFVIPILYCMQCRKYYISFCQTYATSKTSKNVAGKWKSMLESLKTDKDLHALITARLTVEVKDGIGAYSL